MKRNKYLHFLCEADAYLDCLSRKIRFKRKQKELCGCKKKFFGCGKCDCHIKDPDR